MHGNARLHDLIRIRKDGNITGEGTSDNYLFWLGFLFTLFGITSSDSGVDSSTCGCTINFKPIADLWDGAIIFVWHIKDRLRRPDSFLDSLRHTGFHILADGIADRYGSALLELLVNQDQENL